ncbi:hypothetical protein PF005_g21858 [Phytophthora fragariae]|uniref:Uncharacterized protein n=1 Tax=Phytophthora fragariae TaxID=53985 RepID=A0A6A3E2L4_9STRA|nr:hypothetical protein PF003_g29978 [Phytophthora fragariae]KAE8926477.1 hypothetical protein PF009_g23340 [Phytophthora fragariae]KAE8983584.1 hypothetical protein PF011_g21123 [Phytophthora fragariae]KAE9081654.1 hypothetical protein PF007_g22579 [Phytophthora fragariae]KAE9084313.1 hypothetical protein PF010_g20883 [Phytophthora fragariae]
MVMAGALCGAPTVISSFARGPLSTDTVYKAQTLTLPVNYTCVRTQDVPPLICNMHFNGASCVKSAKNRHPVRMSEARMKQYRSSIEGAIRKDTKTNDIPLKHLSIHKIQVMNQSPLDLNFDDGKWT